MLKIKMTNGNEAVIEDADIDKFPGAELLEEIVVEETTDETEETEE